MSNKMTIFYSGNTGEIEGVFSGEVDFSAFANREADVRAYCKKKVTNFNGEFLALFYNFKVNLQTNIIEPKEQFKITL